MAATQSKYGRRFDEEFKREVTAWASRPGAKREQVARDLGVSPYIVARSKKLRGGLPTAASPGVSMQALDRAFQSEEVNRLISDKTPPSGKVLRDKVIA